MRQLVLDRHMPDDNVAHRDADQDARGGAEHRQQPADPPRRRRSGEQSDCGRHRPRSYLVARVDVSAQLWKRHDELRDRDPDETDTQHRSPSNQATLCPHVPGGGLDPAAEVRDRVSRTDTDLASEQIGLPRPGAARRAAGRVVPGRGQFFVAGFPVQPGRHHLTTLLACHAVTVGLAPRMVPRRRRRRRGARIDGWDWNNPPRQVRVTAKAPGQTARGATRGPRERPVRWSDDKDLTLLVRAATRGDAEALSELVRATQHDVWRFVAHLAGRDVADDLAQETYVRALRSLRGFRQRAPVRVWLLAVARRVVADHFAEVARERRRWERAAAEPVQRADADPSERLALHDMIAALDPGRRDAFVLTQVIGLSYADAAAVCSCPVGTIRSRVARARDELVAGYYAEGGKAGARVSRASARRPLPR